MKKKIISIIIILFFSLGFVSLAPAQEEQLPADPIYELKTKAMDLMEENKRLLDENEQLGAQLTELQGKQEQRKKQKRAARLEQVKQNHAIDGVKIEIDERTNQLLIEKSKLIAAKSQWVKLEDKKVSLDLELSRIKIQKDLAQKNAQKKAVVKDDTLTLSLDEKIKVREKQLQSLKEAINTLEQNISIHPQRLNDLKRETLALEKETEEWQKKLSLKARENDLLKDKMELNVLKENSSLISKREEQKSLRIKIEGLEKDLNELNSQLDASLSAQKRNRGLLNEIIQLDAENQELRARISELKENSE